MKKRNRIFAKSILGIILALSMVLTALPENMAFVHAEDEETGTLTEEQQALLEEFENMDLDLFAARALTDNLTNTNSGNNNTTSVNNILAWQTPSEFLYDDLESKGTTDALTAWKVLTFKAEDAVENAFTEKQAYELILMEILQCSAVNSDLIDSLYDSSLAKLPDYVSKVTGEMKLTCTPDDVNSMIDQLQEMDVDSLTDEENAWLLSGLGKCSDAVGTFSTFIDHSQTVYDLICKLMQYDTLSQYYGTTIPEILSDMKSETSNQNLIDAIDVILVYMESKDAQASFQKAIMNGIKTAEVGATIAFSSIAGDVIEGIIKGTPLSYIVVGQDIGTAISNKLCGTKEIGGKIYTLEAYNETIDAIRKTVEAERTAFTSSLGDSDTSEASKNAKLFKDTLNFYLTGATKGCDYAEDFADALNSAELSKLIVSNAKNCNNFKSDCEDNKGYIASQRTWLLDQLWKVYFTMEYPDIYDAMQATGLYADWSSLIKYVDSVALSYSDITVRSDAPSFYVNAYSDPYKTTLTFTSSKPSVATVGTDGWITPVANGTTKITVTAVDPVTFNQFSNTLNVTVSNYSPQITINNVVYYLTEDDSAVDSDGNPVAGTAVACLTKAGYTDLEIPETVKYLNQDYAVTSIKSEITSGYSLTLNSITLPETLTTIQGRTFQYCKTLTSITIPDSVTTIYSDAFFGCTALTEVVLPKNLTSIANELFCGCTKLASVTIQDNVLSIGTKAFAGCTALTSISIPEKVQTIGANAFNKSGLTSVTIPESVQTIGDNAFGNCTAMTHAVIQGSPAVGAGAFAGDTALSSIDLGHAVSIGKGCLQNTGLISVTIPAEITELPSVETMFSGDSALQAIYVAGDNSSYASKDGILYDKNMKTLLCFPQACAVTSYTVPSTVIAIADKACLGASNLVSVTIHGKVATIGTYAFSDCAKLTTAVLKDGITAIDEGTFNGCEKLGQVTLPSTLKTIGNLAFEECTSLKTITLPAGLTEIGMCAFDGSGLTSVLIPKGMTTISYRTFADCDDLKTVTFASGSKLTQICQHAFDGCGLTSFTLPASVTSIDMNAFYKCNALTSFTFASGSKLETIGDYVFYGDKSLKWSSLVLPSNLKTIGKYAFYGPSITKVTIPATVYSIGAYAFADFGTLTDATFKGDVPYFPATAFSSKAVFHTPNTTEWTTAKANRCNTTTAPKVDISQCQVKVTSSVAYTGKALTPAVTVYYGATRIPGYQYTLKYSNNTIPGKGTVTVTGANGCTNSKTATFKILLTGTTLSSVKPGKKCFTAKWKKQAVGTTGYQLQYATSKTFAKGKTVTVKKTSTVSKKITGLTSKKTYYVRIRTYKAVGKKNYYSSWSSAKKVKVK